MGGSAERLASQVSASLVFASFPDISDRELIAVLSASARAAVNERGGAVVVVRMRSACAAALQCLLCPLGRRITTARSPPGDSKTQ